MKYLNTYKLFETEESDRLGLLTMFGISEDEVRDIMQDTLDSMPEIDELKIEIKPLYSSSNIYNMDGRILDGGVDYFIVWINKNEGPVFNDIKFKEMIPDIDSKFGIYGLEVFYASPLSNRSIGSNIWIKRIKDKTRDIKKIPKVEIKSSFSDYVEGDDQSIPPHIQEGLFSSPDKDIDIDTLKDIIDSEISGIKYMDINVDDNISFHDAYYKSDRRGHPKLKREKWFNKEFDYVGEKDPQDIEFAHEPDGNFHAFISRGINKMLTRINSGNYNKGIEMRIFGDNTINGRDFDIREAFQALYHTYISINKDRLKEYGIGCCLFSPLRHRKETYSILFYPL